LCKAKGAKRPHVVKQAGISVGYLSQIERNQSKLPIGVLKRISAVLGVHINWFFQAEALGPPTNAPSRCAAGRAGD